MASDNEKDFSFARTEAFQAAFNNAYDLWFPWITEAHTDYKYYIDNPWTSADLQKFSDEGREVLNFNIIRRIVKIISGYERKNRLSLRIGPAELGDDQVASQYQKAVMYLMENNGGYQEMSDGFELGPLTTGANLIEMFFDRQGDIHYGRKAYNTFLLDPGFTRRDLSDCNHIITHDEGMSVEDIKLLLPGMESEIEEAAKGGPGQSLPFSAYLGQGRDPEGKRANYSTFWERKTRKAQFIADRRAGEITEWKGDKEDLAMAVNAAPTKLVSFTDTVDTVKFSAFVNDHEVHAGADPNGIDDYPYVLQAGFWYPEYDDMGVKLQGIVRPVRDPQREVSKRMSQILNIIETQTTSGYEYEEGTFVNPKDAYFAGSGKAIPFKANALSQNKVRRITAPGIPPGLFKLNDDLQGFVNTIVGVNDALFGSDELKAQISTYVMKLRTGLALVTLQDLFDHNRAAKAQIGRKTVKMIQANYSRQRFERIIGEKAHPDFRKQDLAKYDIVPQEGLYTETQRQSFFVELRQAKADGMPIPWSWIAKYWPTPLAPKLLEAIQQAEKTENEAKRELMEEKKLLDQMRRAKIDKDISQAEENRANVQEHEGDAQLSKIKAVKEIQEIDKNMEEVDFNRLIRLLELFNEKQEREKAQSQALVTR